MNAVHAATLSCPSDVTKADHKLPVILLPFLSTSVAQADIPMVQIAS